MRVYVVKLTHSHKNLCIGRKVCFGAKAFVRRERSRAHEHIYIVEHKPYIFVYIENIYAQVNLGM